MIDEPYKGFYRDINDTNRKYEYELIDYDQRAMQMCGYFSTALNVIDEKAVDVLAQRYGVYSEWCKYKEDVLKL